MVNVEDKIAECDYISVRLRNLCRYVGIQTVGDLVSMSPAELMRIKGITTHNIGEIDNLRYELGR